MALYRCRFWGVQVRRSGLLNHGRGIQLPYTPLFLLLTTKGNFTMSKKQPPKRPETSLRGRDAKTGEFIPVNEARQRPSTTVVERVPLFEVASPAAARAGITVSKGIAY